MTNPMSFMSNLSIRQKMLVLILGLTIVTYLITFMYVITSIRNKALDEGKKTAMLVAQKKANEIKSILDEDLAVARIMAEAVEPMINLPEEDRNQQRKEFLDRVLIQYPKYDATWMSWQLELIDENWEHSYGRERYNSYLEGDEIKSSLELAETDGRKASAIYEQVKADGQYQELLTDPYWYMDYDYTNNSRDSLLGFSTVLRLEADGQFAGVIGADMNVTDFQSVSDVDFYENAHAVLLTSEGVIIAHKDLGRFNQSMDSIAIFQSEEGSLRDRVKKGESFDFTIMDEELGEEVYVYFASFPVGRTNSFWTVSTVVPVEEIMAPYTGTFTTTAIVVAIGLAILTAIILYISYIISTPLERTTRLLESLADGKLSSKDKLEVKGRDEISQISRSMNRLVDSLETKMSFAQQIENGNLDAQISVGADDELGKALVSMQQSLRTAIGDIKSMVKASEHISDNVVAQAEDIHRTANIGFESSNSGLNYVNNMSESMNEITTLANETNTSFKVLEKRTKDITKVVRVITNLSKQTNMLAINAAIQAARAGEAGKAFTVVSNEIRKLAENSGTSATEINQVVMQIQSDTSKASRMIEEMTASIHKGESATQETSDAFRNINTSVSDTVSLSESILGIARQQIDKIKEVSRNTENMVIN